MVRAAHRHAGTLMSRNATAIIPIRTFEGMSRLSRCLEPVARGHIGRKLADRVAGAATGAGLAVTVVTSDADVVRWAHDWNIDSLAEPDLGGLDNAAAAAVASTESDRWLIVHADLPAIASDDLHAAAALVEKCAVLAPSHDGGTSLIGGSGNTFPFQYGPGSFRRHLAALHGRAAVLVRPGLALDLDRPWDLAAFERLGYL